MTCRIAQYSPLRRGFGPPGADCKASNRPHKETRSRSLSRPASIPAGRNQPAPHRSGSSQLENGASTWSTTSLSHCHSTSNRTRIASASCPT